MLGSIPFRPRCNLLNHLAQSGELGNGLGCRRAGGYQIAQHTLLLQYGKLRLGECDFAECLFTVVVHERASIYEDDVPDEHQPSNQSRGQSGKEDGYHGARSGTLPDLHGLGAWTVNGLSGHRSSPNA